MESRASSPRGPVQWDLIFGLVLFGLHAWGVWGYTGVFWGDHGTWLHEVERFANGEIPYLDFSWHFPPLALWLLGSAASVLGTDLTPISAVTTGIGALLVLGFVYWSRLVLGKSSVVFVISGLLLAAAYAQTLGVPLPLGLYAPAALVGATVFCTTALLAFRENDSNNRLTALAVGLFAGLSVLAKQDFWIPALFCCIAFARVGGSWAVPRLLPTFAMAGVTIMAGVAVVVATAGIDKLPGVVGGFGQAIEFGGRGSPSWARLVLELVVLSTLAAGVGLAGWLVAGKRPWAVWAATLASIAAIAGGLFVAVTIHVAEQPHDPLAATRTQEALAWSVREGVPLVRPAIGLLVERVRHDPLPALLAPSLLLLIAVRWRRWRNTILRDRVAMLLGLCVCLRARRLFEGTEWFEFLFSLPVFVLTAQLIAEDFLPRERRRLAAVIGVVSMLVGLYSYHDLARGPLTRRQHEPYDAIRGRVFWPPNQVRDYQILSSRLSAIDPEGRRPLLSFGFAGFNYFLDRRNPSSFTYGFYFAVDPPQPTLTALREDEDLLLVDNPFLERSVVRGFGRLAHWERGSVSNLFATHDRPLFERLSEGCQHVEGAGEEIAFRLLDCSTRGRGVANETEDIGRTKGETSGWGEDSSSQ